MEAFDFQHDLCLGFFAYAWEASVLDFPPNGRVLELGSAEADWLKSMRTLRPDLHLTAMDQRKIDNRKAADRRFQHDLLSTKALQPQEFDAIIAVSTIEWVGLGKYGDPVDPDGDLKAMQRARTWIKPTGWMYFDVPHNPLTDDMLMRGTLRAYGEGALRDRLLQGQWREVWRQGFTGNGHPDGPYMALKVVPV